MAYTAYDTVRTMPCMYRGSTWRSYEEADSDSVHQEGGLRFYISEKLPDDTSAAGP